ncbi:NADH:flavin oxidoreductase [Paraburkholderia aromaticivorans]|uniref:NADH:flavin oxidoreductase n=1 Tax=Paraburkholderia aromaticivorans TaxID=2026199 RepID=A0A248VZN5_9BURK|nr:NADH:flavin oxidoreductase [Paraburkholderia aromaticivorans]ASW04325.1 NADH:flavin oxidoreductase [Paraburkholderia aromaticivorans]
MTDLTIRILSQHDIKGAVVRNRLAVAPMTRVTATEEGLPTQTMRDYYMRFAKGGFGLVVTEGLYTDKAFSQGYRFQPGLADDAQARAWADITREMQGHGALVFAQLMHAGALSQGNRFRTHTVAPSAIRPKGQQMAFYYGEGPYAEPAQITDDEIAEVIQGFVDAAARAVWLAGFDGVEIHGANGYLLDQFLTAETNRRTDRWGGDAKARVSLLVEIVKAVKAEVGNEVPVGIRISQGKVNDFTSKWPGREADADVIFGALAAAGADFIHVTEFEAWQPAFEGGQDSLMTLARRYAPGVSIIANGSLQTAERTADALGSGADFVALGRGALANPDLPKIFETKREPRSFDSSILGPIANIKASELLFEIAT